MSPTASAVAPALGTPDRGGGRALSSALSLYGSTLVTAALGFAYWAVAAGFADAHSVGSAGAAVATMQLVGTLATLGLGSVIIAAEGGGGDSRPFAGAALRVAALTGLLGGIGVGAAVALLSGDPGVMGGPAGPLLFGAGCSLTSLTMVLDLALVGRRRASRQLLRNAVFAVAKLALLPLLAWYHTLDATSLYVAWALGNVVSLLVVLAMTGDRRRWLRRAPAGLAGVRRQAAAHHVLNVADHCAVLVVPLLVTVAHGPTVNAAFYFAMLVAGFCWIVPAHLSTALFAVAVDDRAALRRELRVALGVSVAVWAIGTVGALATAWWVLGIVGAEYEAAAAALVWLVAATLPFGVRALFGAVSRVEGRLAHGAAVIAGCAAVNVVVAAVTVWHGITVMTASLCVVGFVQAVWLWPPVARAAGIGAPGRSA